MMTGEQLGVGHEPRHGTAYVSSWIKALENDPKEIRAAAVDAQRISDWLLARERERSKDVESSDHERPEQEVGRTPAQGAPDRSAPVGVGDSQTDQDATEREMVRSARAPNLVVNEKARDNGPSR